MLPAREFDRRLKKAIAFLREGGTRPGARRLAVEISPDGATRVIEAPDAGDADEGTRVGRLIEERMSDG